MASLTDTESSYEEGPIVPLVDGRLYLLPNPYRLDGRVCTHPPDASGWASQNCYLFVENDRAVLVDTGFSIHEASMLSRLEEIITPDMTLEVSVLRLGEYYGSCNVRPIVERFGVQKVYSARRDGVESTDFRPDHVPWGTPTGTGSFATVEKVQMRGNGSIEMGVDRTMSLVKPPLRLLSTNWLYDAGTRTLLTADMFTHSWLDQPDGPWVSSPDEAVPSAAEVRAFMVGTRYWWLPGSRTAQMVVDLHQIFDQYEVDRIAPGFGLVIEGSELVKEHVRILSEVLEVFSSEPATGVDAGYTAKSTKRAPMAAAR
ncbi:conserved hypothetical protein [metagenome]|uniref:Metallo-beta-lactamase domain-containing protein n=1 Tax=metagenome TaxID=256318 RepID=A0A2P2C8Z7_9ZZZZ